MNSECVVTVQVNMRVNSGTTSYKNSIPSQQVLQQDETMFEAERHCHHGMWSPVQPFWGCVCQRAPTVHAEPVGQPTKLQMPARKPGVDELRL